MAAAGAAAPPINQHRFFNAGLRDRYERCVLPTQEPYVRPGVQTPHAVDRVLFAPSVVEYNARNRRGRYHYTARSMVGHMPHVDTRPLRNIVPHPDGPPPPRPPRWKKAQKKTENSTAHPATQDAVDHRDDDRASAGSDEGCGKKRKRAASDASCGARADDVPDADLIDIKENAGPHVIRAYKIQMLPDATQRRELKRCFSMARFMYNNAVAMHTRDKVPLGALRDRCRKLPKPRWAHYPGRPKVLVPSRIESDAVEDAILAIKANYEKRIMNPNHHFDMRFRSLKNTPTEAIGLQSTDNGGPLQSFVPGGRIKQGKRQEDRMNRHECRAIFGKRGNLGYIDPEAIDDTPPGILLRDSAKVIRRLLVNGKINVGSKILWDKRIDKFHLQYTFLQRIPAHTADDFDGKRVVALDPGCRPFQQWYSPTSKEYGELCVGMDVHKRLRKIDKMDAKTFEIVGPARRAGTAKTRRYNHRSSRELQRRRKKRNKRRRDVQREARRQNELTRGTALLYGNERAMDIMCTASDYSGDARICDPTASTSARLADSAAMGELRKQTRRAHWKDDAWVSARAKRLRDNAKARSARQVRRARKKRARGTAHPGKQRPEWRDRRKAKRKLRRKRHHAERRLAKERVRFHGWIVAGHYTAAKFLFERFDVIIAPVLQTSRLVRRQGRALHKPAARAMMAWSHYGFRQRLKSKAPCYPGCHVVESTEPGTSKTCGHCGNWKARLGRDMVYNCDHCGMVIDRQVNGARNNFLSEYGRALGIGWDGVDAGRWAGEQQAAAAVAYTVDV